MTRGPQREKTTTPDADSRAKSLLSNAMSDRSREQWAALYAAHEHLS
jgi:hypothetical protein